MVRPRKASTVTLKGKTYCRVWFGGKRIAVPVVSAECAPLVFEVASCLEEADRARTLPAGWEDTGRKLIDKAGTIDTIEGARKIRTVLAQLIAGRLVLPSERVKESEKTFRGFGEAWTSGALHERSPDHVPIKKSVADDVWRLEKYVYPILGNHSVASITLDDVERVRSKLPKSLGPRSRRHVLQLMTRLFHLAVFPFQMIAVSPIPRGYLPPDKLVKRKAFAVLYPAEEQRLIECEVVPVDRRVFYAISTREGMRKSELAGLTWDDFDFVRGTVALDDNKTNDPRGWALADGVPELLKAWRLLMRSMRLPSAATDVLFPTLTADAIERLATTLRGDLQTAGVKRSQLFESNDNREALRAHDLRATFVTVHSAIGKSETWITDRTAHRSSGMVRRYQRQARQHAELNLGPLASLNKLVLQVNVLAENRDAIGRALLIRKRGPKGTK